MRGGQLKRELGDEGLGAGRQGVEDGIRWDTMGWVLGDGEGEQNSLGRKLTLCGGRW